jgi:hypothetical protein
MSPCVELNMCNHVFVWPLSDSFVVGKKYFVCLLQYYGDNLCNVFQVTSEELGKYAFQDKSKWF